MDDPIQLVLVLVIVGVFVGIASVFWYRMFQDMSNNDRMAPNARNNWILYFLLFNVFGAILYFFSNDRRRL